MAQLSDWLPVAEAARLTGYSVRTIKRMVAEGQIRSSRTLGNHMRVLRADLDGLLRQSSNSPVSVSSVLAAKREGVESVTIELQTERAKRELAKLRQEDAEAERQRTETRRAESLANKRGLAELRLQRERDAERREREQHQAEAERHQAEFERRWTRWAADRLFAWLSFDQRQCVLQMVEETVSTRGPEDEDAMQRLLVDAIARLCAPWAAEREAGAKREKLIEEITRRLPFGATDAEKARATADARTALSQIPLTAGDLEIRAAVSTAVQPIEESVEARIAADKARQDEEWKQKCRKWRKDDLVSSGVQHVATYIGRLHAEGEITIEACFDFEWRRDLEKAAKKALQSELTGSEDETREDAERIAQEIVDVDLE
jgi:excisionase family DNA binding protein